MRDYIEELWYTVHPITLLWASITKEFQDLSFFFIHLNWEGFYDGFLKLEQHYIGVIGSTYV